MWDPYAEFETVVLPNGLTVHAAYWPERPWEAMGFLVHSGAERDPVGLEGVAHFVEHLVSKNAGVSSNEIRVFFKDCGGTASFGATSYSSTCYRFFVPTDKLVFARALSMFGSMLFSAKLEKRIEQERQIIIGEFYRRYPIRFEFDLDLRENKALYANYWLERFAQPIGAPESIGKIAPGDLQSYYDAHYTPANVSVVGVGGMKLDDLIKLFSESPFAVNKRGARTPLPVPVVEVGFPSENRYVFEISNYASMATPAKVGAYRSVAKIPGNINVCAIRIMRDMFNEVLMDEVRERRMWAYHIGSSWCNFRHFYEFLINCNGLVPKALDEIEKVIEACIVSMMYREDLFERVKRRALTGNFVIDPTGRGICNGAIDDIADYQRIISLTEYGKDIEHTTMADICILLQCLHPQRRWTLIVKP